VKASKIWLSVGRNPDAGIRDPEVQDHARPGGRFALHRDRDFALSGELDRVADQVDQHLPDSSRVASERLGNFVPDFARQLEALLMRAQRQRLERLFDGLAQREGDRIEVETPGLDLGKVEDVVDDQQQVVGRAARDVEVFALFGGQVGVEDKIGHSHEPFMGVRISWLMLARNSLFTRLACSARSRADSNWTLLACRSPVRRSTSSSRCSRCSWSAWSRFWI
jgi:hypothetical protein